PLGGRPRWGWPGRASAPARAAALSTGAGQDPPCQGTNSFRGNGFVLIMSTFCPQVVHNLWITPQAWGPNNGANGNPRRGKAQLPGASSGGAQRNGPQQPGDRSALGPVAGHCEIGRASCREGVSTSRSRDACYSRR